MKDYTCNDFASTRYNHRFTQPVCFEVAIFLRLRVRQRFRCHLQQARNVYLDWMQWDDAYHATSSPTTAIRPPTFDTPSPTAFTCTLRQSLRQSAVFHVHNFGSTLDV